MGLPNAARRWNAVARAACLIARAFSRFARFALRRSIALETALNRAARRVLRNPFIAVRAAARCFARVRARARA